jgi:hypothetical protein
LVAPTVSTVSGSVHASTSSADRPADVVTTTSSESLLQHEGPGVVVVLLVPVTVALVGALGDGAAARRRRIAAGSALAGVCVLGAASVGIFFLPAPIALLTAGLKTGRHSSRAASQAWPHRGDTRG